MVVGRLALIVELFTEGHSISVLFDFLFIDVLLVLFGLLQTPFGEVVDLFENRKDVENVENIVIIDDVLTGKLF
jgi:hypothetical protein